MTTDGAPELILSSTADQVIATLLEYRLAEEAMRRRTRDSMRMGTTDLQALRFLIKAQGENRIVSGRDVADHLGMTSASVTALLDRLTKSGHVKRTPHPTNRRSNMVTATPGSDDEVRQTLGAMHARMIETTRALSPVDADVIRHFLESMTAAVDSIDAAPASDAR
ncbi:MarR family winged helix-turn-helix transcriptional regulator [Cryobacterium arcticum]|uniref:MarR family transcriptional regulator n=1 Tax=Cryobacterium arcticum TaxID=670052 RepID=A0A318A244_9MICO|nr:MarR family transcriptional regulator [Cryobacterium arcticum]PXA72028.1 MarR family transcriptional regulator [Cryobacterium arcticum]